MKKALFIGVTKFDFKKSPPFHLEKKYLGLGQKIRIFVLSKGKPFHKRIWGADFYLMSLGPFFWPVAFLLGFYLCLAKKIDVIVAQSPLLEGTTGSILKKLLRKELIVEIHGDWLLRPFLAKNKAVYFLEKKFVPVLARFNLRNADKIRAVADYLLERAKIIAPAKKYFLFPTFTDLGPFSKEQDRRFDNFILFVGRLEEIKGIKYLIAGFNKIKDEFPQFRLVIIGSGSQLKSFKFQVSSFKLEDRVEFKGALSSEETKNIMKNCYCLVAPSLSEGLPRVILEAMALSKPVIASNVGGIPEIVKSGESGLLFEKANSEDLAEKLKIILINRELAELMGKRARQTLQEKFSNEKYIENYIKMLYA